MIESIYGWGTCGPKGTIIRLTVESPIMDNMPETQKDMKLDALPYDVLNDFTPISPLAAGSIVLYLRSEAY